MTRHNSHISACNNRFLVVVGQGVGLCYQIPDLHNLQWLSIFAAIMSFPYTFIGLALRFAKVLESGEFRGDFCGVSRATAAQKVWLSSQEVRDIDQMIIIEKYKFLDL